MKEINLRDYYPFYTTDAVVSVPDEVAGILEEYRLMEEAHRIRTYRHKAYFSLDLDGMAEHIAAVQLAPFEIMEKTHMLELLYRGLASLPEKQARRIYARYFLGMSCRAIARAENCSKTTVSGSIDAGLRNLRKFFEKNSF